MSYDINTSYEYVTHNEVLYSKRFLGVWQVNEVPINGHILVCSKRIKLISNL